MDYVVKTKKQTYLASLEPRRFTSNIQHALVFNSFLTALKHCKNGHQFVVDLNKNY